MAGKESLKSSFVEIVKSMILSGTLKSGDKLPPERVFAKEVGMSRGSINQGVLDLERMGFVTIVPRKGTYVTDYTKKATPETLGAIMSYDSSLIAPEIFKDFMELRVLIERECVRLCCLKVADSVMDELEKKTEAILLAEDFETAVEAIYEYHRFIAEISGNGAYYMVFQSFEKMIRNLIREHYTSRAELDESIPMYRALTDAIKMRDENEADMRMQNILQRASEYLNAHLKEKEKRA